MEYKEFYERVSQVSELTCKDEAKWWHISALLKEWKQSQTTPSEEETKDLINDFCKSMNEACGNPNCKVCSGKPKPPTGWSDCPGCGEQTHMNAISEHKKKCKEYQRWRQAEMGEQEVDRTWRYNKNDR